MVHLTLVRSSLGLIFLLLASSSYAKWVPADGGPCGELDTCPTGTACYRPDEYAEPRLCLGHLAPIDSVFIDGQASNSPYWPILVILLAALLATALIVLLSAFVAIMASYRLNARVLRRLLSNIPPPAGHQIPLTTTHSLPPLPKTPPPVIYASPPFTSLAPSTAIRSSMRRVSFARQPEPTVTISAPFVHFHKNHRPLSMPNLASPSSSEMV